MNSEKKDGMGNERKMSLCERISSLFSHDKDRVKLLQKENRELLASNQRLGKAKAEMEAELDAKKAELSDIQKLVESLEKDELKSK